MNKINKKIISIIILILVSLSFVFVIYLLSKNISSYREKALGDYATLTQLELDKKVFSLYKKALSKDSDESKKIQKYIFYDDRKELLFLINELEDYTRRNGLSGDNSSIVSVSKRENANLSKFKARDLVINISVVGELKKIEEFIKLLNTMPLVSYIEKIDVRYDYLTNKNSANIILIIYQKDEIK